jgi:hypothetical protein
VTRPNPGQRADKWEFEKAHHRVEVGVEGPLISGDEGIVTNAALAGVGLAYLFEDQVAPLLEAGALTRALDDWCPPIPGFFLYYPGRRQVSPALAAVIDAILSGSDASREIKARWKNAPKSVHRQLRHKDGRPPRHGAASVAVDGMTANAAVLPLATRISMPAISGKEPYAAVGGTRTVDPLRSCGFLETGHSLLFMSTFNGVGYGTDFGAGTDSASTTKISAIGETCASIRWPPLVLPSGRLTTAWIFT